MLWDQIDILAWTMAISSGLMSGIYLSFSVVIMKSLATLDPSSGIAAMNAINKLILKTLFMPLFYISTVIALVMTLTGLSSWGEPGAAAAFTAGLIYLVGMFALTVIGNVPLNNALAKVSGNGEEAVSTWNEYLVRWTRWNTVRAISSLATMVICLDLLAR
ncbi:MAG: DUF1772 domain-containing protein [Pseudomonadaceae bacterium]|nr:DUF1772 domain-containing protein [Pseudomonadaceae bacterium]